ncbi:MAG: beta-ketoacyl synthase N-terminal-like domain-containing protein [Gemmatimonadales bacterium]
MTAGRASQPLEPIAIVGIGCRFPGGVTTAGEFWHLLASGLDAIKEIPSDRIDLARWYDEASPGKRGRIASKWGGFVDRITEFDASFFEISPREAERMDPQQRLLLEIAWEAMEDAGIDPLSLDGSRTGVFVGQWVSDFENRLFLNPDELDFLMTQGSGRYATSGRLSFAFGFRGPSLTLDTACSSSLATVHLACHSIRSGECAVALAGGVNIILQPHVSIAYSQSRMMATGGRCRFGDAAADGYVRSEGAALVLLKSLSRALADGDSIYALVCGSAVNNDGRSSGVMGRPSQTGHEELLRSAYTAAGIAASEVTYVEAHGTGTRAGDPVELAALGAVLGENRPATSRCLVGSVKTNIGHTEGAAGIAGLIKAALALHHGAVPASLHFDSPNPTVPWSALPFDVPKTLTPWPRAAARRVAGVNSFGIAGTNAHVVLVEAPHVPEVPAARPELVSLLPLSAKSREALHALVTRYRDVLVSPTAPAVTDLCWSAATGRAALRHRAAFVGEDIGELSTALEQFLAGDERAARETPASRPKIAFVFPGQGAQWEGMGRELMQREPVFRETLSKCDAASRPYVSWSIVEQLGLPASDPAYALDRIEVIQPVLVSLAIAYAEWWRAQGIEPDAVVGHSMGEIGAAYVAGVLDLDQAMQVVCRRSALMQRTSGRGAMALVELPFDDARARIRGYERTLSVAVSNSPRSSVISGDPFTLQEVLDDLGREGVFCRLVKVDVASHSPQMDEPSEQLARELAGLRVRDARVPIYSTVLARRAKGSEFGADYWKANLREPVRFAEVTQQLCAEGFSIFVELGPHPLLLPPIQQTAQSLGLDATALGCGRRDEPACAALRLALGEAWSAGAAPDWSRVMPSAGRRVPLPLYPWQRERHWVPAADSKAGSYADLQGGELPPVESSAWLHHLEWVPSEPASSHSRTPGESWLVAADDLIDAELLTQALSASGVAARACTLDALRRELPRGAAPVAPGHLVVIARDDTRAPFLPVDSLQAVLELPEPAQPRLWFVTRGAQSVGMAPEPVSVDLAALWGAARVVAEEHPSLRGGLVDLASGADVAHDAARIAAHLLSDDGEDQVAFRAGQRHVLRFSAANTPMSRSARLRPDAAYLITGGIGEIGLHVARTLVSAGARHLVLTSRTPLPPRGRWAEQAPDSPAGRRVAAVRGLESLGVAVHTTAFDVGDETELQAFLTRYASEARPPIRGVVHAAGALDNALASRMDREKFDGLLRGKLCGARALDRAFPDADMFVLFSSTGSFLVQSGQANYAAANAGLDAIAYDRRSRGQHAVSIGWGIWRDTGLVRNDAGKTNVAEMRRLGIGALEPVEGAALFDVLRDSTLPAVSVLPIEWHTFARTRTGQARLFADAAREHAKADGSPDVAAALASRTPAERRSMATAVVREAVSSVLKIVPARLDPKKTFGSMGLNSLLAMELRNRLEGALGRALSATIAWNYPTIEALAAHLADDGGSEAVPSPVGAATTGVPPISTVQVSGLSDADAARALRAPRPAGTR